MTKPSSADDPFPGRHAYRIHSQVVAFILIAIVAVVLGAIGLDGGTALGVAIGAVIILVPIAFVIRAAFTVLLTDRDGVVVRNITRTVHVSWPEIGSFHVGRHKLLGCVLIIRLTSGESLPVFAVQGITGQPRRKASVAARGIADELNKALKAIKGVVPTGQADGGHSPSRADTESGGSV